MVYTDEQIARVIHAANSELQRIQGDLLPSPPWDSMPEETRRLVIRNVAYARDDWATPAALHDAWLADKAAHGWRHGDEKDPEAKTHPCMVAYDKLPREQRDKTRLFAAIVEELSK